MFGETLGWWTQEHAQQQTGHLSFLHHSNRIIRTYHTHFGVLFFFWGGVTATAPSRDLTDNKKEKRREGSSRGESKRKLLKETQNQRKETRKKKKNQVEYRVEGAQDRRRRRKPGGWKETPNTRKRGGDAHSCSCLSTRPQKKALGSYLENK